MLWLHWGDWRIQGSRILLRQTQVGHERNDSQHWQSTALFENVYAVVKEGQIPPELVDDQSLYQSLFLWREQPEGAEQLREYTAARDIAH